MLHLVLAESALELVPEPLWSHPSVSKSARARSKRPGQILLDDTYHHSAMRALADKGQFTDVARRGRPDIIHTTLMVALEARLNKAGKLHTWIHTYDDRLIWMAPEVRLQRAQHRFFGLVEQLLEHGVVPPGAQDGALLRVDADTTLDQALVKIGADRVVVMDEEGEEGPLEASFEGLDDNTAVALVVGGFPEGRLRTDLSVLEPRKVAFGREPLTAWAVAGEAIVRFQLAQETAK